MRHRGDGSRGGIDAGHAFLVHDPPPPPCGISGTAVVHGTSVFRDTGNGTYFMSGTFFGVFTADNGKSATLSFAGPVRSKRRRP